MHDICPAGWRRVKLAEILHEHGLRSTGIEPVYSVSVHRGLVDQVEHLGRSYAAADTSNYNRVLPGDVVYTKSPTGEFPLGIIKQSQIEREVIVSPLYGVFTPRTFDIGFLLDVYFSSPDATERYLTPLVHKGAKNTINVTNTQFLQGEILMAEDDEEIAALAAVFKSSAKEINTLDRLASTARQRRRGLMQKLLTGEWRVGEVRISEVAG